MGDWGWSVDNQNHGLMVKVVYFPQVSGPERIKFSRQVFSILIF